MTFCGSPVTISPEMFSSDSAHSFEVDWWAIGVILYYMLYGQYPFENVEDDVLEIYRSIQEDQPRFSYSTVSREANDLIKSLLYPSNDQTTAPQGPSSKSRL